MCVWEGGGWSVLLPEQVSCYCLKLHPYLTPTPHPISKQHACCVRVRTLRSGRTSNDYFVFGRTGSQIYTQKPAILTGALVFLLGPSSNSDFINCKPNPDARQAFLCNTHFYPMLGQVIEKTSLISQICWAPGNQIDC
jgi:DNA-binding transcriptional LysR family regulator